MLGVIISFLVGCAGVVIISTQAGINKVPIFPFIGGVVLLSAGCLWCGFFIYSYVKK